MSKSLHGNPHAAHIRNELTNMERKYLVGYAHGLMPLFEPVVDDVHHSSPGSHAISRGREAG
jgi:hypothetical protein